MRIALATSTSLAVHRAEVIGQVDHERGRIGVRLPGERVEEDIGLLVARLPAFDKAPDWIDDPVIGNAALLVLASFDEAIGARGDGESTSPASVSTPTSSNLAGNRLSTSGTASTSGCTWVRDDHVTAAGATSTWKPARLAYWSRFESSERRCFTSSPRTATATRSSTVSCW